MKKLVGEIDFTWKKLIVFAILAGVYTAVMALIPITKDTCFRDIAIHFEVWILFGIIIICNSKSPKDSALKCFIFFLISQPLVYLLQVPFSEQGNAELIQLDDSYHIQLNGRKGGKYSFEITDNNDVVSLFEYYFDKEKKEVILIKKE